MTNHITIRIDTENAAFIEPDLEIARILKVLVDKLESEAQIDYATLMDINGNKVGEYNVYID